MSWQRYAWWASVAFGLSVIGIVASYLWDSSYFWWPLLFVLLACAVALPLVVVRPLLAMVKVLRSGAEPPPTD